MRPELLHGALEAAAQRHADRPALLAGDSCWSYADLDGMANAFARHLSDRGVRRGDRVAVMTANRPEFVVVVNAVSKAGAAAVLVSPAWKALEVRAALDITQPAYAVADGAGVGLLGELLGTGRVVDLDHGPSMAAALGNDISPVPCTAAETDDAVLVFSSGTTGLPKAVRHTHRSMAHATVHWRDALGLTDDDRFQVATPPSHILGLLNLLTAACAGATVRLHRRFDLDEVLQHIAAERMTLEMAVAPIALALANHPRLEDYDLSSLRYIMWGATPVTPSVAEVVTRRTGVRWLPAYGASELPAGVALRIVDLATREVLAPGAVGEIQARSPSLMAGYLPDHATAEAFEDGWYRTGDVGWLEPGGWIHLTDRVKEMIKVSGFQVAPAEIEAVLHGHPAVRDCAVFGVPDQRAGEVPVAAVALNDGVAVTADELRRLVAQSLATYKQLRDVVIVDDVPRLPSGKVLRRTLRERWVQSS